MSNRHRPLTERQKSKLKELGFQEEELTDNFTMTIRVNKELGKFFIQRNGKYQYLDKFSEVLKELS